MKKTLIALTFILFIGSITANAQKELVVIKSRHLKCNDSILVFTPIIQRSNHIPTLFLLHGWSGCYKDWSNHFDIQEIADRTGFRIICPNGFYNSWYVNDSNPAKMQWRKFFWEECFPRLSNQFNLDPSCTFISGLSMGGHGAINIFFDNPSVFRAAGSMSGVLNLEDTRLKVSEMTKVMGPYTSTNKRFTNESAITRLNQYMGEHPDEANTKTLVISCGYDDSLAPSSKAFCEKCKDLGIPYMEFYSKATHSWTFWGFALEQHIWLFQRMLNE